MTYRTGIPTLRGVVDQIERMEHPGQQPVIKANGRAVRLKKGKGAVGEKIYDIRTRPVGKGREWNFARRIAQEKALVERFEKEIDKSCGEGMGRKLTKSVGAYDKFLNPKMDALKLSKLQKRADQIEKAGPPPPGLKIDFDENDNLMWVGRVDLSGRALQQMKTDLKMLFAKTFIKEGGTDTVVLFDQFKRDLTRSNIILEQHYQTTNLRGKENGGVSRYLQDHMYGDAVAASNSTAIMNQETVGCVDVSCSLQTKYATTDQSDLKIANDSPNANRLSFTTERQNQDHIFSLESHRGLNSISYDAGPQTRLDSEKSWCRVAFGLKISHRDLATGEASGFTLVGKPDVEYRLYPKPKDPGS
jgi:hypothetical protein